MRIKHSGASGSVERGATGPIIPGRPRLPSKSVSRLGVTRVYSFPLFYKHLSI